MVPRIHPTAFVDASAQVIGDVEIGADSGVWMAAVIRGDVHRIRIGCRTNVQDSAVVHVTTDTHPATIGDEVTIGHAAVVHGCTIEDCCLVGIGAIVLDGATIGSGSIVAAGALIPPGAVIPPRSLVMGTPGRVKRTLGDADLDEIRRSADRYVAHRLDYMAGSPREDIKAR